MAIRKKFFLTFLVCGGGVVLAALSFVFLFGSLFLGMAFVLWAYAAAGHRLAARFGVSPWLIIGCGVGPLLVPLGFFVAFVRSESQEFEYLYVSLAAVVFLGLCAAGPIFGARSRGSEHAA